MVEQARSATKQAPSGPSSTVRHEVLDVALACKLPASAARLCRAVIDPVGDSLWASERVEAEDATQPLAQVDAHRKASHRGDRAGSATPALRAIERRLCVRSACQGEGDNCWERGRSRRPPPTDGTLLTTGCYGLTAILRRPPRGRARVGA